MNGGRPEDFAHVYYTDVLQIRIDRPLPTAPAGLSPDQAVLWPDAMLRTLVEAVRIGAAAELRIEQRDLAATSRVRAFGYPEIVLYDSAAGGAGYCQLLQRHGLRSVIERTVELLDCPEDCTYSCRCCLCSYDNQVHWDQFNRRPVLKWLRLLLGEKETDNPFAERQAVPLAAADPDHFWLGRLESPGHLIMLAARLFPSDEGSDESPAARIDRLAAWMHKGGTLEIGITHDPMISADLPHTIRFARVLAPLLHSGQLKIYRLPLGVEPARLPRVIANPGKIDGLALFSIAVADTNLLQSIVSTPAWHTTHGTDALCSEMMRGWQILPATALDLPRDITVYDYQPGQVRQFPRDFAFAKGKEFDRVTIDDPFVLKSDSNALCLRQLLDALDKLWVKFPALIHIRTRYAPDTNQGQLEENLRRFSESRGGKLKVDKIPAFGAGRRDLHDRRLSFAIAGKTPKRIEVLLTGGIDRYLEPRFETSVIVRR